MAADLSQYLDVPDALLQEQMPGVDIAALKESIRKSQREKEGNVTPVTQTIKTDPVTGEQTMTVSGSVEDLSPKNPLAPTVTPGLQNRPPPPAVPVNPADAYNRYTQQMESGANPNIGYHNPEKSTAYGAYGITQPQYQEIQKQNPAFANRPITSLNPQEQAQANTTSRDVYAQQLRAKGVEPTEENLRMAHLLGAGGTSQYLKSGTFNPQSVAANGGEEQLRRMVEQRRQGPVAPQRPGVQMAAGPVTSDVQMTPNEMAISQLAKTPGYNPAPPPPEVPAWHNDIVNAQKDPMKLYAIAGNPDMPEEARRIARDRAVQFDTNTQDKATAAGTIQAASEGDPQAAGRLMKALRDKSEGSWVKALLLQGAGFSGAANKELEKLSGGDFKKVIVGGKSYMAQIASDGSVINAWDAKGVQQNDTALAKINAESTPQGSQAFGFTGGSFVIPQGQPNAGQEYRQRTNSITGQIENVITTGPNANEIYRGKPGIAQSVGTSALKMDYGVISKYREKFGTDALAALSQMQKDRGPMTREEQDAFLNQYGFQAGVPGVGAVPGAGGAVAPQAAQAQALVNGAVVPQRPPQAAPAQGGAVAPVNPAAAPAQAAPAQAAPAGPVYPVRGLNEPENAYKNRLDIFLTREKEVAKAQGKIIDKDLQKQYYAKEVFPFVTELKSLVNQGTGSGFGSGVDSTLGFFGVSTPGADAIAATAPLAQKILMQVERFEGPQSDIDVKSYKEAAGKLADPNVPTSQKQAALKSILGIMKRNAPDLDWESLEKADKKSEVMNKADEIINKGKKK